MKRKSPPVQVAQCPAVRVKQTFVSEAQTSQFDPRQKSTDLWRPLFRSVSPIKDVRSRSLSQINRTSDGPVSVANDQGGHSMEQLEQSVFYWVNIIGFSWELMRAPWLVGGVP